jgi:segregation and condensation protein A
MDDGPDPEPGTMQLQLDGFEGPLDLLLDLARRQQIDLARISVTMLADQFLRAIAGAPDLMRAADWLVMAAWLTWLKSRTLLPAGAEAARQAEQARQTLAGRLAGLAHIRSVADWLDNQPRLGWDTFEHGYREPEGSVVPEASYRMLLEGCLAVLRAGRRAAEADRSCRAAPWTPRQAAARIREMLRETPGGGDLLDFLPVFPADMPGRTEAIRAAIASTLAAGLELTREGCVLPRQDAPLAPITLRAADPAGGKAAGQAPARQPSRLDCNRHQIRGVQRRGSGIRCNPYPGPARTARAEALPVEAASTLRPLIASPGHGRVGRVERHHSSLLDDPDRIRGGQVTLCL